MEILRRYGRELCKSSIARSKLLRKLNGFFTFIFAGEAEMCLGSMHLRSPHAAQQQYSPNMQPIRASLIVYLTSWNVNFLRLLKTIEGVLSLL